MYVAYYRVSTAKQGVSGLGLDAQRKAVTEFCKEPVLAEFTDIESGREDDRPQLTAALAYAKRHKATLVVAKLDRLSRDTHFISGLTKHRVDFVAVDQPHANKLLLHILAAIAEEERDMISARTKAALAAAKARGVQLGKHAAVLNSQRSQRADAHAQQLASTIQQIRADGHRSVKAIALQLNARGIPTAAGGEWHATSVARSLRRIEAQQ